MGGERRYGWRRLVNRYTPLASAIVGAALVASNLLFLGNRAMWFATIVGGLLILQGGVWYASRPFLTSERRYLGLRAEFDRFTDLMRQLNAVVVDEGSRGEFERLRAAMHNSVERMAQMAGQPGEESSEERQEESPLAASS